MTAIILILLASWFLRIHDLGAGSFWLDEIKSFTRATLPDWQAGREALIRANHAPLYEWIVLRTWLNVGSSEFLARFPGAVFSMLTISVTYALAISLFRRKAVGVWASLFLMASALYLGFARWIRPYALHSFLLTLAVFCLWRAMSGGRRRYWFGYAIAGAGALYTHYYAAFTLLMLALFVLFRSLKEKDKTLLRDWALSSGLIALLFLPWLTSFQTQYSDGAVGWIRPLRLETILRLPASLMDRELLVTPIAWAVALMLWVILALGLLSWIHGRSGWPNRWSYPFTASVAAGTVLIAVIVSITKPLIVPRYFLGALPIICILFAFSIVYALQRRLAFALGVAVLGATLFASYTLVTQQATEDWKAVAAYLGENLRPEDTLFQVDETRVWTAPFNHYYQGPPAPIFVPGELRDPGVVQTAIDENCPCERIWFVQSARQTGARSVAYEPQSSYSGYQLVSRVIFDEKALDERLAVDLWLLEKRVE
jgi:4-amino-4-deoxy-L-arabinose transferase-like glycosyltransferase